MNVLTIGGATIDTIVSIVPDEGEQMVQRQGDAAFLLLELGRKREAEEISIHCGGGAANAAVAMARLGCATSTIVKLGRDFRADIIRSHLAAEGISTLHVICDGRLPTGASVLLSSRDRNTAVVTFRGANTTLTRSDLDPEAFDVDLVYVAGLSDHSADCFGEIVTRAKSAGALVAVNPGIRQLTTRHDAFCEALGNVDILAVNMREAEMLIPWLSTLTMQTSGALLETPNEILPDLARSGFARDNWGMTLARFVTILNACGPRWVVVTNGKDGAYIGTASGLTHCPAIAVEVVGTAGAGDAFNATFAAAIAAGATTADAVTAAAFNSASVVTHLDTQTGLLTGKELAKQVAERPDALRIRHWPYR